MLIAPLLVVPTRTIVLEAPIFMSAISRTVALERPRWLKRHSTRSPLMRQTFWKMREDTAALSSAICVPLRALTVPPESLLRGVRHNSRIGPGDAPSPPATTQPPLFSVAWLGWVVCQPGTCVALM